jgi:hypothetical protein
MKVTIIHASDALEPPPSDPVIAEIRAGVPEKG